MISPLAFFKCLADDTRLKCLLLLTQLPELCVCDLQAVLQLSQPKVSRHLRQLHSCGLLADERRGKWVYYRLHPELPEWAGAVLRETLKHNGAFLAPCSQRLSAAGVPCCEP
ncbi:metalloregulator ArsR/SmtB family transcription factor [Gallaecimonas sp. GXIMD1310]|uniref:metalloregulator ArsR/SmtB family transcription factor n=1 Tax=Gallaecimonas sp. GXIMD1310 TaxID=3131926 RepID=UPI0032512FDE